MLRAAPGRGSIPKVPPMYLGYSRIGWTCMFIKAPRAHRPRCPPFTMFPARLESGRLCGVVQPTRTKKRCHETTGCICPPAGAQASRYLVSRPVRGDETPGPDTGVTHKIHRRHHALARLNPGTQSGAHLAQGGRTALGSKPACTGQDNEVVHTSFVLGSIGLFGPIKIQRPYRAFP